MDQWNETPAREQQLSALADVLDQARAQGKTLTYLQAADAINMLPPHRIHQVTELLEALMEQDHTNGQPLRAALVVSRTRSGRPADGFYLKARAMGVFNGQAPHQFHEQCLHQLFKTNHADRASSLSA